jgi:repressor LexA
MLWHDPLIEPPRLKPNVRPHEDTSGEMTRKRIKPGTRIALMLSPLERDLIVERTLIDPEMEEQLRCAQPSGSKLVIALTLDDVDDLAGHVAAEANHCDDKRIRRSLDAVYDRLAKLEAEYTDEESASKSAVRAGPPIQARFTAKQGQYLAFIYYYSKIHGRPPAEADLQRYFRVSPPVVHQMILTLEARGLIERSPGQARSIHLRLSRGELPDLE